VGHADVHEDDLAVVEIDRRKDAPTVSGFAADFYLRRPRA